MRWGIALVSVCSVLVSGCTLFFDPARLDALDCAAPTQGSPDDATFAYRDSACATRDVELDGSALARYAYSVDGTPRAATGLLGQVSAVSSQGMGTLTRGDALDQGVTNASTSWLLRGAHHAIRLIEWDLDATELGGPAGTIHLVVHWLLAAGRDHPVYAITWDLSALAADAVAGDSRAPWGRFSLGPPGTVTSGMAWGDERVFTSLGAPLTDASGWDYTERNTVPFVMRWSDGADAELGLVQTQSQAQHAAGGGNLWTQWDLRDADGPLPPTMGDMGVEYPFYLGQTADGVSTSQEIGWGMCYGAVGWSRYPEYGDEAYPGMPPPTGADGYPFQSYSVLVVHGTRSDDTVRGAVRAIEQALATRLTARVGTVSTTAPRGVGDARDAMLEPPGWDARYAAWRASAASDGSSATLELDVAVPADALLVSPVFVVEGMRALDVVRVDGAPLRADQVLSTPDASRVWVTLRTELSGTRRLSFVGSP